MVLNDTKRLVKYGFLSKKAKEDYSKLTPEEREEKLEKEADGSPLANEEYFEMLRDYEVATGYPDPLRHYRLITESPNTNIESYYYWFLNQMKTDFSMQVQKVVDTYAATEHSSYFANMQSRLSIQQQNVGNYLKGISEMVKGLWQIVREIRLIKMRLELYYDTGMGKIEKNDQITNRKPNNNSNISEMTLKDVWVSQVEGGSKNPSSVIGLAQTVGFTILPDIFYRTDVKDKSKINDIVDGLKFNVSIKRVLKEKLKQYIDWKEKSFEELEVRKNFQLKYMRQHYNSIMLYVSWIKPYLKYMKKLKGNPDLLDSEDEMISSFEGSFLEIEVLGRTPVGEGNFFPVVVLNLQHRIKPEMNFTAQEYQHKGPLHVGKTEINIRGYSWTKEQIDDYIKFRHEEDLDLLSSIDDSIKAALDSQGKEIREYLKEAGEKFDVKKPKPVVVDEENKKMFKDFNDAADPFISVFKGFGELFGALGFGISLKSNKKSKSEKEQEFTDKNNAGKAGKGAEAVSWLMFKNYKKAHKMLTW